MHVKTIRFAAFVLYLVPILAAQAADTPQAKLVETEKDHGSAFVGTTVQGKIVVENTGTVPFSITDAKTSCHCTTAIVSKGRVDPGQRGEVSYEIKTMSTGRSSKSIRIVTDPPLPENLIFTATATFMPFIETDPSLLTVEVQQGQLVNHRIPLTLAKGVEGVTFKGVSTRTRDVKVALESSPDGKENTIVLTTDTPLPPGKRQVRAAVQYVKDGDAVQDVIITIKTLALVRITPDPIMVKFDPGKNEYTVDVNLKHEKGETFAIKSITGQFVKLQEVKLPATPAAEYTIPITILKEAERTISRGSILFEFEGALGKQTVSAVFRRDLGIVEEAAPAEK